MSGAIMGEVHCMPQPFSGNFEVVRILIEYDPAYINARDEYEWTPLFSASEGDHFEDGSVLRLLLEHGADINVQGGGGETPLHWASFNGRWGLCACCSNTVLM
jgi:ankyrin repeat protein